MKIERYVNGNEAAVLIHTDWGCGFSTANPQYPELAVDKRVIEKYLQGASREEMYDYLPAIGYKEVCLGGWDDRLDIEWVKTGTRIYISEYDGRESIECDSCFITI